MTQFNGIGGCETHAATLLRLLQPHWPVQLWADQPTAAARQFGATPVSAYSGQFPRGGNLLLLGTHLRLGAWIDHVRPRRLIVMCVLSNPAQVYAALSLLERPSLPSAELLFVSSRLQQTLGLPGSVCPEPIDLQRFAPAVARERRPFTIGRHSRDVPEKHHRQDPSLYRLLDWNGFRTRIMGGTCLSPACPGTSGIELLPAGSMAAEEFLRSLDCFFYRTGEWAEPSGRVVMEALASGLPAIVHENGGYTDWIEQGRNGYVFSTQEEALELLRHLAHEPELCQDMGRAARASAERLAGAEVLNEYLARLSA